MTTYLNSLADKRIIPNIVIRLMGQYFSIRAVDSGLVIPAANIGLVSSLNVSPTTIDPFRPSTTIQDYSFKLLDSANIITAMFGGNPQYFQNELVEIWVGRNLIPFGDSMDFSEYMKLSNTYVTKCSYQDNSYSFQAREEKDRLSKGAYSTQTKLAVDILAATTVITVQDVSNLPTNGFIKIDDEFISYTGIIGSNLQNCIRGEQGTVPANHDLGSDVYLGEVVQDNAINILLKLLISSGGGGAYDTLIDGAAIDQSLIDIAQMEQVRDEFFTATPWNFKLIIYNLDDLKKFIDEEICYPLGIRLRANSNAKIGLALLDRNIFDIDAPVLTHDTILKKPSFDIDNNKIKNRLRIFWDWSDAANNYLKISEFTDADSITQFGKTDFFEMKFKGIRDSLGGATLVNDISLLFLGRFAFPKPTIGIDAQMDVSNLNVGDKTQVVTTLIPNTDGVLDFYDVVEDISRAINFTTSDVKFQLAFTSFTGVRQCYLAPSDTIISFTNQKTVTIGAGRGANWRKGWKVRLYDNTTRDDNGVQVNEIASVVGDVITFVDNWVTVLVNNQYRLRFADYDEVAETQKRFCFMSLNGNNFYDGKKTYQISFG